MSCDVLADLRAAQDLVKRSSLATPLPEAYLRDRTHLRLLEAVTRLAGRDPFPTVVDGTIGRIIGMPIFLDPEVPEHVLELRWPDGRIETVYLPTGRHGTFPAGGPLTRSWFEQLGS